jgi:hypothetical protein
MGHHDAIQNTNVQNVRKATQKARTRSDHAALGKYFENAAREMRANWRNVR